MKRLTILILILFSQTLFSQSKKKYNIEMKPQEQNGLLKLGSARDGKLFEGKHFEYSILNGGYFTFGTSSSNSNMVLDNKIQLTYGHPYALTSFIKVFNDGKWYNPIDDYEELDFSFNLVGDSLSLQMIAQDNFEVTLSISENEDLKTSKLSVTVKNLSELEEEFNVSTIFDAALGKWGDGYLFQNNILIENSIEIENLSNDHEIKILERKGNQYGIGHKLIFDENSVSQIKIANWRDFVTNNSSSPDELFDLAYEIIGNSVILQPNDELNLEIELELLNSNFGNLFLRGEIPSEFSIEENLLFPQNIDVFLELYNNSQNTISNLNLKTSVPYFGETKEIEDNFSLQENHSVFRDMTIPIIDLYEDVVIPITVECFEGSQLLDSFERNIFIPAVPISDTGLVVVSDSLINNHPEMGLRFNVRNKETGAFLYNLQKHNIFFYQNDERITDFRMMKDTSNGVTDIDVAFVLDVTGSMSDEIDQVKKNIVEFADSLEQRGYSYNLGLVTFLDEVENVYDFTSDVQEFQSWIADQYAHGGGDYPENSLDALMAATQLSFRESSNRVIIWITDASYQTNNSVTPLLPSEVSNALISNSITTHCIGNEEEQVDFYEPITTPTGGDYYNINGNFRDILLDIARLQYLTDYLILYDTNLEINQINSLNIEAHYAGLGGSFEYNLGTSSLSKMEYSVSCYPNPFNPVTRISVSKPVSANGVIEIFNILGQRVLSVPIPKGSNNFDYQWNGCSEEMGKLSSGVYLLNSRIHENGRLVNNNTIKLMLLK